MAILEGMTTVIHPGTWSQHPFVSGVCFFFFWDALYTRNRDSESSMINATTRERRLQRRFDYGYWNVFLLLGKVINAPYDTIYEAIEVGQRGFIDKENKTRIKQILAQCGCNKRPKELVSDLSKAALLALLSFSTADMNRHGLMHHTLFKANV